MFGISFNRTFMELKHNWSDVLGYSLTKGFNRTFMELKPNKQRAVSEQAAF